MVGTETENFIKARRRQETHSDTGGSFLEHLSPPSPKPREGHQLEGDTAPLQDASPAKAANVPRECELTMQIMILREWDQYKRTHIRQNRNNTYYLPKQTLKTYNQTKLERGTNWR